MILARIQEGLALRDTLQANLGTALAHGSATFRVSTREDAQAFAPRAGFLMTADEDVRSLHSLILFGLIRNALISVTFGTAPKAPPNRAPRLLCSSFHSGPVITIQPQLV